MQSGRLELQGAKGPEVAFISGSLAMRRPLFGAFRVFS
jgi:hypothetical protein